MRCEWEVFRLGSNFNALVFGTFKLRAFRLKKPPSLSIGSGESSLAMAETGQEKTVSVDEERREQSNQIENLVETTVDEKPDDANPEEAVKDLADEITAPIKTVPVVEEQSESSEQEAGEPEAAEEKPVIKIETAPADFRFPTTNQTRHCFTRYIEYHRCIAVKGEDAPECEKFAKYYRSLCPSEWVERWNEQRENGTFPGPL